MAEIQHEAQARVIRAELKVEAVRAGIVDLDGLKLLDLKDVELTSEGELSNAAELVAQLQASASHGCSVARHPPAALTRHPPSRRDKSSPPK